jgi:hypothetical protein
MSFTKSHLDLTASRREFMATGARTGAALAAMGGAGVAGNAFASTMTETAVPQFSADLLQALGARIGLEVATALGDHGTPLTLAYLDAAGPSVDALRSGIEQGVSWHTGAVPSAIETQIIAPSVLGVALISNPVTGRSARVEIDTTALSMIAMIESGRTPPSAQKHAVLTAGAHSLYRVSYLA